MSKHSKQNRPINRKAFVKTICKTCKLCGDAPNPLYCYSIYEHNPCGFVEHVLKKLRTLKKWPSSTSYTESCGVLQPISDYATSSEVAGYVIFKDIFCNPYTCDELQEDEDECPLLEDCMTEHRKQMYMSKSTSASTFRVVPQITVIKNKVIKNNNNKKEKYVTKPESFFFCNKESEEEIRQILRE